MCVENHHFFQLLNGHPQAISLVASLLQNKRLVEVYELTAKQMLKTLQIEGIQKEQQQALTSIKVSLDYSI